jgi:hypothetical protein
MYLAKVTFNNNNWIKPSGPENKLISNSFVSFFESNSGFGWEEWNFSPKRLVDDKYYGFLQSIHFNSELRRKTFENVYLFSQQKNLKCYLIGKIKKLTTLSFNDSRIARESLCHTEEMRNDIENVNGDIKIFNDSINISINCFYSDFKIFINNSNQNDLIFSPQASHNNFKGIYEVTSDKLKNKILELESRPI